MSPQHILQNSQIARRLFANCLPKKVLHTRKLISQNQKRTRYFSGTVVSGEALWEHVVVSQVTWAQRCWNIGKVCAKLFCCSYAWVTRRLPTAEGHSDGTAEQGVGELERCLATHCNNPYPFSEHQKWNKFWTLKGLWMWGAAMCSGIHFFWCKDHGRHFYTSGKKRGAKKHIVCFLAEETPSYRCGADEWKKTGL